jgi:hypothetical protein
MLIICLSGKAREVFAKIKLMAYLCGDMTIGEYAQLSNSSITQLRNKGVE